MPSQDKRTLLKPRISLKCFSLFNNQDNENFKVSSQNNETIFCNAVNFTDIKKRKVLTQTKHKPANLQTRTKTQCSKSRILKPNLSLENNVSQNKTKNNYKFAKKTNKNDDEVLNKEKMKKLESEKIDLESKVLNMKADFDNQIAEYQKRDKAFQVLLRKRINETEQQNTELINLKKQISELKSKITNFEDNKKTKETEYNLTISNLESKIISYERKILNLEEELKKEEDIVRDLRRKQRKLMEEYEEKLSDNDFKFNRKLKEKDLNIETLDEENIKFKEKIKVLNTSLLDRKSEIEALNQTISSYSQQITSLKTNISSKEQLLEISTAETKNKMEIITRKEDEIKIFERKIDDLNLNVIKLEEKSLKDEKLRKILHNTIQELKGNIRVYCRVRPSIKKEKTDPEQNENNQNMNHNVFTFTENTDQRTIEVVGLPEKSYSGKETEAKRWEFTFDHVFKPWQVQSDVFEEISQLVQSALDGYKVCIFAYGQTGSGKTYTMEGPLSSDVSKRGMIPRSVNKVFQQIEILNGKGWVFESKVMILEIYNETLRDLLISSTLNDDNNSTKRLEIKHLEKSLHKITTVTNAEYVKVDSALEIVPLLKRANKNRAVGQTDANEHSSRSHLVFQLSLNGKNKVTNQSTFGILNLIDLAGSERLNKSKSTGTRLKEAQAINSSLSALKGVITALNNHDKHIPYRDSKLTYLLQNCFGGDSKTLMFVNLSPEIDDLNESLNSLRFASNVNACHIGTARRNIKI